MKMQSVDMVRAIARGDDLLLKKKGKGREVLRYESFGSMCFSIYQSINRKARDGERREMSNR